MDGACALRPRFHWPHRSLGGPGVAARGGGSSPRFAAEIVDFILRRRVLEPAKSREAVRLESELEGDSAPAREFPGAGKRPRVGLHALQTVTHVLQLRAHDLECSSGAVLTAGSLRVTPNAQSVIRRDNVYASFGRSGTLGWAFAFLGARMEILLLIPVLAFAAIYAVYREWLNATHRRWLAELDLYKKRLATYEELKRSVAPLRAEGSVSQHHADRFRRAM